MDTPLHQSDVKTYLRCPRSFHYRQTDDIQPAWRNAAAVHGTIIHRLIEQLHQGLWNMDVGEQYIDEMNHQEFHCEESTVPIYWKTDRDTEVAKLQKEAIEIIDGYRAKDYNREANIILSESTFLLKLGRAGVFQGTVDQIRKQEDGSFELVDLKTSKFAPDQTFLDLDYQLGLYSLACRDGVFQQPDGSMQMLNIKPSNLRITWYHLRDHTLYKRKTNGKEVGEEKGHPRRHTSRTEQQLNALKRDLSAVASSIRRGIFPRHPSTNTCPTCAFASICVEDSLGTVLNRSEVKQVQHLLDQMEEAA